MVHHLAQFMRRSLCKFSIMGIPIQSVLSDFRSIRPMYRIDNDVDTVSLVAGLYTPNEAFSQIRHIHLFKLSQTV